MRIRVLFPSFCMVLRGTRHPRLAMLPGDGCSYQPGMHVSMCSVTATFADKTSIFFCVMGGHMLGHAAAAMVKR